MKKIVITSPKFNGEIHVVYATPQDGGGKLQFIDFLKADLSEQQIAWFKERVPVFFTEQFKESFPGSPLTVMEQGYKVTFEQFWDRYDKKINRKRVEQLWSKLTEADQVNAFFRLAFYERFLKLDSWRTKADPETYLKKRSWENEWK